MFFKISGRPHLYSTPSGVWLNHPNKLANGEKSQYHASAMRRPMVVRNTRYEAVPDLLTQLTKPYEST